MRFYGGSPSDWLHLPLRWINVLSAEMKKILAMENMREVSITQLAMGMAGESAASRIAILERDAGIQSAAPSVDDSATQKADDLRRNLAMAGIPFDEVEAP